ncbi:MAG: ArsA family ATPase [Candidatus Dormibacteria bacterium]
MSAAERRLRERRTQPKPRVGVFDLGKRLSSLPVIICAGSGGVGKTTISAALGMAIAASADKRVLVLTVDPAKRLATALGLRGIGSQPVAVPRRLLRDAGLPARGELVAAMLDMKSAWDRLVECYAPDRRAAQRILENRFYQRISDAFIGSQEYAAMEALYELHEAAEYDCVIVDTPPSRNALDFLEAPNRLSDYVGARLLSWLAGSSGFGFRAMNIAATPFLRLADRLLGGDVLAEVAEFVRELQQLYGGVQRHARDVYRLLRSPSVGFVVVTSLDPGPFAEAEFFATKLREFSMPLRAIVVNRMLPESLRDAATAQAASALEDNPKMAAWLTSELGRRVTSDTARAVGSTFLLFHTLAQREARQLSRLERLGDVPASRIPLFTDDVSGLEGLVRIAGLL